MPQIATAAAEADLDFVVLTDHGDATGIAAPAYYEGVLMIDGVEVSTDGGHYAALGLGSAPYPLGGDARGVIEDVRRLGGIGIAAHPTSPRPALAWSDPSLPVDAVEWINGDSEWRDENWTSLAHVLFGYWIRPAESLALMLDRPESALALWDDLASRRRVVGIGAADAHGRLSTEADDEGYGGEGAGDGSAENGGLRLPGYEPVFRALSVQIELDRPLIGQALPDAAAILSSLREGRVYTVVDAIAGPARVAWTGRAAGGELIRMGEWTPGNGPVDLIANVAGVEDATFTLLSNGAPILAGEPGPTLTYRTPVAPEDWTAFRVEVFLPDAPGDPPVPWIVSNPIYVGGAPADAVGDTNLVSAISAEPSSLPEQADDPAATGQGRRLPREWQVEQRDAEVFLASNRLGPETDAGEEIQMTFELGSDVETYAAAVQPLEAGELVGTTAVRFETEASQPMRLSLQLRRSHPAGGEGDRWRRSFYVGTERRAVTVPFDQLVRVTPDLEAQPDLAAVDSLLIVVDTVNTFPGTRGSLTIVGPHLVGP
ncbi:MAG: hypothetical protein F4Y45_09105 [Acidobacteria bacterium]|nr:hypothetical protein [Acidobacteriota bacterium]MYD69902.1 hypothetical protein [Acidobacteriota bacterium]MYJ03051.1 hypothetical protein [Acidobacteriota bacterium]